MKNTGFVLFLVLLFAGCSSKKEAVTEFSPVHLEIINSTRESLTASVVIDPGPDTRIVWRGDVDAIDTIVVNIVNDGEYRLSAAQTKEVNMDKSISVVEMEVWTIDFLIKGGKMKGFRKTFEGQTGKLSASQNRITLK